MEIKNLKNREFSAVGFFCLELALALVFVATGWAVKTAPVQAACSVDGQYFCSGSDRRQYYTRFGKCSSRFISSCQYGCSNGSCNPAPACTPNCSGDQCGQSNGCGGSCGSGDSGSCGKCGNAACCTDNGTRNCDAAAPSCGQTTYGSYFDNCGTNRGACSRTGPACPVDGACGTADDNIYDSGASGYSGSFCSSGSTSTPSFPGLGGAVTWTCSGANGGASPSCTAYRRVPTPSLSVSPGSYSPGSTLTFSWGGVSGAVGYGIAFKRNGTWDSNWTWVGNVTSYNFSTSGLSGNVEGQVTAYSSYVYSYNSNVATATPCTSGSWTGACTASCGGGTNACVRGSCPGSAGDCSGSAPACNTQACVCTVISVCSDANTVYTRNTNCSTSSTNCPSGCYNGVCKINGSCGAAATNYAYSATGFSGAYCASGTASPPNPSFPAAGGSSTWSCNGSNTGTNASCTATRTGAPVTGSCGTNAAIFESGVTYYTGTVCATGIASPTSPAFPGIGAKVSWACNGANGGANADCSSYRRVPTPSLSVSPTSVATGATLTFSWGAVSGATGYGIAFKRNGAWDSGWTWIGNVTSYNFSTSGLSGSVEGQVVGYSNDVFGNPSSAAASTIVPPPTADIKANNSNGPIDIGYNTSANITWSSTNASSCSITQTGSSTTWTGTFNPGQSTGNLLVTRTYSLSCTGTGGTAADSVQVRVAVPTVSISSYSASPPTGQAPLSGVDFTIGVGGNAVGDIRYQIDCTSNGSYEKDTTTAANPYTAVDACNFITGGNQSVRVVVTRDSVVVNQTYTYTLAYPDATADIKAQLGNNPASDGPLVVPANSVITLSWFSTDATACAASGDWNGSRSTFGSQNDTISTASKTYNLTCTGPGVAGTDFITVNPIPLTPANLRITSAAPYVKGQTLGFAWDASPAATYYLVAFYPNGIWDGAYNRPSPQSSTAISYSNTSSIGQLSISVTACNPYGCGAWVNPALNYTLLDPTPLNLSTGVTTTSGTLSGSLVNANDVRYVKISPINIDQLYRVNITSGNVAVTVVDASGNPVNDGTTVLVQSVGRDIVVRVPAGGGDRYLKFSGSAGPYNYTLKRFRRFPYLEAQ